MHLTPDVVSLSVKLAFRTHEMKPAKQLAGAISATWVGDPTAFHDVYDSIDPKDQGLFKHKSHVLWIYGLPEGHRSYSAVRGQGRACAFLPGLIGHLDQVQCPDYARLLAQPRWDNIHLNVAGCLQMGQVAMQCPHAGLPDAGQRCGWCITPPLTCILSTVGWVPLRFPRPQRGKGQGEGAFGRNCSFAYATLKIPVYCSKCYCGGPRHIPLMEGEGGEPL
jgi:hypothetical protein